VPAGRQYRAFAKTSLDQGDAASAGGLLCLGMNLELKEVEHKQSFLDKLLHLFNHSMASLQIWALW